MSSVISSAIFEGAQSLYRANKRGDISLLIERLRSDSELLLEEREFLADLVEGKRKLPPNRPATYANELRDDEMIEEFLIERAVAITPKAAERVSCKFKVSTRHLHRIHGQLKNEPKRYQSLCKRVSRQVDVYRKMVAACERDRRETIQARWDERRMQRLQSSAPREVT